MTATTRKTNQGTIVEFSGALTIGDGTLAVGDAMDRFIASCDDRILIDLSGVSALDSAGVRVLVQSAQRARDAGVPLGLVAAGAGRVRRVLDTLNLQACIPTYESLTAGLACLAADQGAQPAGCRGVPPEAWPQGPEPPQPASLPRTR